MSLYTTIGKSDDVTGQASSARLRSPARKNTRAGAGIDARYLIEDASSSRLVEIEDNLFYLF
jgi:hypothetical protein